METFRHNVNKMAGMAFDCPCGQRHSFNIKHIYVGSGVLPSIIEAAEPFKGRPVFLYGDQNTFAAAGRQVKMLLQEAGFDVVDYIFQTGDTVLIPNENALGRLLMKLPQDTGMIIGVGSGTLNDLGKYLSAKVGIPYAIVCTAPSMDGYVSNSSAFILEGRKVTLPSTLPYALVSDLDILKDAPDRLLQAGFGDLVGKITALADWKLARDIEGDAYCETCVALVERALDIVNRCAEGIKTHDAQAVADLFEGLLLTGVAMCFMGITRPASGAEHMLSHYWEMDHLDKGQFPELHGIKVGVATPVIAELFHQLKDILPQGILTGLPTRSELTELLQKAGAPAYPSEGDIGQELFHNSILFANTVRQRYSVLQFAIDNRHIEASARALTQIYYG